MKKWIITLMVFSLITIGGILFVLDKNSVPAITYFPLDEESSFIEASTSLNVNTSEDSAYWIDWTSVSESEQELFLRQDVSLLFANGKLLGVRSKWEQNTSMVKLTEQLKSNHDAYWESISIHHGEIHENDNSIKSIHQMTFDDLYVYKDNGYRSFEDSTSNKEKQVSEDLTKRKNQRLLKHWQQLISHFGMDVDQYHVIPLTDLYKFQQESLEGFSQQQTNKIIGQLWEGLYKNYIIPVTKQSTNTYENLMPVILIDKQQTKLYVLYEMNGKKEQLIQQIDTN